MDNILSSSVPIAATRQVYPRMAYQYGYDTAEIKLMS
jgi:hypothetical protein